jgi:NADPH2:quinone reductase
MRVAQFDRFGAPEEVLRICENTVREPSRGEVRVRMIASPINPSDLMYVRGVYGRKPDLPASAGFEGVGIVEASGGGLLGWRVKGKRVAVLNNRGGNWAEQVVIPARQAIPIPDDVDDVQAACYFINPASALVMTKYVLRVPPGAWLLQTAAGSALGRMVIRLGQRQGFKTVNVVRRPEEAEELARSGAGAVICSATEDVFERVQQLTGGKGVSYALDPVGGAVGSEAIRCLGNDGRLLVYGTLADEPLSVPSRVLMVGHKSIEGFWLSEWIVRQRVWTMLRLFRELRRMFREGSAATTIAGTYPLEQIQTAVRHAAAAARNGKVILTIAQR